MKGLSREAEILVDLKVVDFLVPPEAASRDLSSLVRLIIVLLGLCSLETRFEVRALLMSKSSLLWTTLENMGTGPDPLISVSFNTVPLLKLSIESFFSKSGIA